MTNKITFSDESRIAIKEGIDKLAEAVKVTLGAKGRTVLIFRNGKGHLTKDGVTIAREIAGSLSDPIENAGATMASEVALRVLDEVGDGTTTASILIQQIYSKALKYINLNSNPILIKRGIDKAVELIVEELDKNSEPLTSERVKQIASVSANSKDIGELIYSAIAKVGQEAVITVEESKGKDTYVDVIEGLEFENGYLSYTFVNNFDKRLVEYNNPFIYIFDGKLNSIHNLVPVIEHTQSQNRPLIIFTNDIQGDVLNILAVNKMQKGLPVAVVRNPYFGDTRREFIEDIAVYTGGQVIASDMTEFEPNQLGTSEKIIIKKESTIIIGGDGDKMAVNERVKSLEERLKGRDTGHKGFLKERISKLTGGVAVVYAGGNTSTEMKEKYDRIEDAIYAVRSANDEGIVEGGGMALIKAGKVVNSDDFSGDIKIGVQIVLDAVTEPFKQIILNAGLNPDTIYEKSVELGKGYNVITDSYVNMIDAGIIDPKKVTRVALESA